MKPILYESTEVLFKNNGVGILSDAISCDVTWERNGEYEVELKYPITGIHYAEIVDRSIILAKPNPTWNTQPFRVYAMTKPINGIVTIKARHISYDLSGIIVEEFTAETAAGAMQMLKNKEISASYFNYWTDKETEAVMSNEQPSSVRSLLGGSAGGILDTYGGEYEFDRFTVRLWENLGENRGVTIRYGKNLTDLKQERSCANTYSGVYPFWIGMDGTTVKLTERIVSAEGDFNYVRIMPLDLSAEWDEIPTEEQLRTRARKYVAENNIGKPKVNLSLSFIQLEQTQEYKGKALLEKINPCDEVNVEFPKLGVSVTTKCIKTVYNCILERYEKIEIGDTKSNFADTMIEQQKELAKKPGTSEIRYAVNALTAAILGATGGYVRLLDTNGDGSPDTLYIADHVDPALATKVWRFNYEGWGASTNGYNGPFTIGANFEQGIIADFITAGTLNANLIRAGILQSKDGKSFLLNIDTGELVLGGYPTEDEVSATIAKVAEGIYAEIDDIDGDMTLLKAMAGQVAVEVSDSQGTFSSVINTKLFETKYVDANGEELSGLYFDPLEKQLVFNGNITAGSININGKFVVDSQGNAKLYSAKFYSSDNEIAMELDSTGLNLYDGQTFFPIARLGYDLESGEKFPLLLFWANGSNDLRKITVIRQFFDGTWIGNMNVTGSGGYFQTAEGANGLFVDHDEGNVYCIKGDEKRVVYTGEAIAKFG